MFRNSIKRIVGLCLIVLGINVIPVFAAKIIVQLPQQQLHYGCPFDVDIMIDTQGEENIGASMFVDLPDGLTLQGFVFGDQFKFNFPIRYQENALRAYAFKFPGVFTGSVKFATLRLTQNERIEKNSLSFRFDHVGDTTDWVDVYYMGGMDALTEIENTEFVFSPGDCQGMTALSGDQLGVTFDQQGHLMGLYNTIDDYILQQKKTMTLQDWLGIYRYYVIAVLLLIILLIIILIIYRRKRKLNKTFKNNPKQDV